MGFADLSSERPSPASWGSSGVLAEVLGRRVLAGLIDVMVLSGLFVVMGALFGGAHSQTASTPGLHQTSFSIALTGVPLVLFIVACLAYYFGLEARYNQTLGKRVMGLRVVDLRGGTPTAGAIFVRTLGRVIDGLPFLYLVGLIAMAMSKSPRQRIGDRLAHTTVAPA